MRYSGILSFLALGMVVSAAPARLKRRVCLSHRPVVADSGIRLGISAVDTTITVTSTSTTTTTHATSTSAVAGITANIDVSVPVPLIRLKPPTTTPPSPRPAPPPAPTVPAEPKHPVPAPPPAPPSLNVRADKHVFAHFMVGIVAGYSPSDWEGDLTRAKASGITGFALNSGVDDYTERQLRQAYDAADKIGGFDLFVSFDFAYWRPNENGEHMSRLVGILKECAGRKSQLWVDGKMFVSTFIGNGFDWAGVQNQVGKQLYAVPFYQTNPDWNNRADLSGLMNWQAWPSTDNKPIKANLTMDRDNDYFNACKNGKTYMAPVSPWFSTHFTSKNYIFYSELLWKNRWDQILAMGHKLNFVQILSWNDYGESHHVGPVSAARGDDGSGKWTAGLDHTAMMDVATPYIKAFRAGLDKPVIEQDTLVYWYRPHLKGAQCDGTDNCGKKPEGWEMLEDSVFITVLSKNGATVTVTSGNNAPSVHVLPAGSEAFAVPMGVGKQHFKLSSHGGADKEAASDIDISDQCRDGIYNFNFHSGSIKN